MATMPTRVDGDLFDIAKSVGAINSRSAAQQINHWARIGREFEASGRVSQRDIERVLAGQAPYDELGEPAQAVVRATWDARIAERVAALDFETEFSAAGESWSDADESGHVVQRGTTHDG
jgi:hypothetical protein